MHGSVSVEVVSWVCWTQEELAFCFVFFFYLHSNIKLDAGFEFEGNASSAAAGVHVISDTVRGVSPDWGKGVINDRSTL